MHIWNRYIYFFTYHYKSNYLLKEPDLNLELNIKTKELDIKEDKIYIKYEILESNNIFEYKIELEDILWV